MENNNVIEATVENTENNELKSTENNTTNQTTKREWKDERFEFALYMDDKIICRRSFKIINYIEGSMQSINFKEVVDKAVHLIDEDLKSKTRVRTWYYFNPNDEESEYKSPVLNPWECTFRFEIYDNGKPIISRIWDGYGYLRAVRKNIDLTNRFIKIRTQEGEIKSFDKEEYLKEHGGNLSGYMYVLYAMMKGKEDVLQKITKMICDNCSPTEDLYSEIANYTTSEEYRTVDFKRDENGNPIYDENGKPQYVDLGITKNYSYSMRDIRRKLAAEWDKATKEKTAAYFKNLH